MVRIKRKNDIDESRYRNSSNHFIMSGKIYCSKNGDFTSRSNWEKAGTDDEWERLANAWKPGHKILSISFKDAIMDVIEAKMASSYKYPLELAMSAYGHEESKSGFRRLTVDVAVWRFSSDELRDRLRSWSRFKFFVDIAIALKEKGDSQCDAFNRNNSPYWNHDHGAEVKSYWKTFFPQ